MKGFGIARAAVLASVLTLSVPAFSQNPFPDEPGRDEMLLACSQCHSAGKMLNVALTKDEWEFTLYDMLARGANLHADDVDDVLRYLQKNFASDAVAKE